MALRKVGVIFTAEGHAQYMADLKQVNQEMRTMSTQSKLAVAQLGNNASITDTYGAKMKSMGAQIDVSSQRTKILTTLQKTLGDEQKRLPKLIEDTNKKYKESNTVTKDLKKSYESLAKAKGTDADETIEAEKAYKSSLKQTNALKKEMKELEVVYAQNSKQLQTMPNDIAKSELATQRVINMKEKEREAYIQAGGVYADAAKHYDEIGDNLISVGGNFSQAGSYMTSKFTVPIVAGYTAATKMASDFHSELGKLAPLLAGGGNITAEHQAQVAQLSQSSREWAINYGEDTSKINAGMADLIRNGYNTSQVMGMLPNILDASLASGEDFNAVMTTSAQVLSQFQLKGKNTNETLENTQRVVDSLTYVANATSSGFYDLGQGMSMVGPVANSLNMSVEETAAILGLLSDNGIEASQGGTALRGALTRLLKPSKQNAEAMEELGINVEAFQAGTLKFPEILDLIATNTANWTDEQRAAAIATAFGTEAQTAMNALVSAGSGELITLTNEAKNASGATKEIADAMKELPEFQFKQGLAQLKDVGIEVGTKLLPMALDAVDVFGGWLDSFNNLSEGTQDLIIKAGLATAAIGPLLSVIGNIFTVSGKGYKGFSELVRIIGGSKTRGALTDTVSHLGKLPTATTAAGAGVSTFGKIVGAIFTPAGLGITALALAGGALLVYAGHVANTQAAARELSETEAYWGGVDLDPEEAGHLTTLAEAYDTAKMALEADIDVSKSEVFAEAIENIVEAAKQIADIRISELEERLNTLGALVSPDIQSAIQDEIDRVQGHERQIQSHTERVYEMQETAREGSVKNQEAYRIEMGRLNELIANDALAILASSNSDYKAMQDVLTQDMSEWNDERLYNSKDSADRITRELKKAYDTQNENLQKTLDEQIITQAQFDQQTMINQENLNREVENIQSARMKADWELTKRHLDETYDLESLHEDARKQLLEQSMAERAEILGIGLDEYKRLVEMEMNDTISLLEGQVDLLGKVMDDGTFEAAERWNQFVADVHMANDDASKSFYQLMKEAGATAEGWNELEFSLLHADLDSNTKAVIGEALMQNSDWNELSFETKVALVEAKGESATREIIQMLGGDWEALQPEVKKIMAQYEGAEAVEEALYQLGFWQQLEPREKSVVLQAQLNNDELSESIELAGLWDDAEFVSKLATIDTNAPEATELIKNLLIEYGVLSETDDVELNTNTNAEETTALIGETRNAHEKLAGQGTAEANTSTNAENTTTKLQTTGTVLSGLNGRSALVTVNLSDNATLRLQGVSGLLTGLNGRVATTYVDTVSRGRAAFAEGGHVTPFATGGHVMPKFASGGHIVPNNFQGLVGEAGPEIFTVSNRGVSITPLSSREKIRGIDGVLEDHVKKNGGYGSGNQHSYNITINNPVVKDKMDVKALARQVDKEIGKIVANRRRGRAE